MYIKGFQNQQKIKLPPVGIKLTTPIVIGLEFYCLAHSANLSFLASFRLSDSIKSRSLVSGNEQSPKHTGVPLDVNFVQKMSEM